MIATIAQELKNNERFLLATHVNPDGDAIGSLGALALVLEGMGKQVVAYCQDEVPEFLRFLPYADRQFGPHKEGISSTRAPHPGSKPPPASTFPQAPSRGPPDNR